MTMEDQPSRFAAIEKLGAVRVTLKPGHSPGRLVWDGMTQRPAPAMEVAEVEDLPDE